MANPHWLDDIFAGVMVAVALYSAGRLAAARAWSRPTHRDVDVAHVLMGTSMAGQLVSDLNPIPNGVWELVFTFLSAWFAWKCYDFVRHPGIDSRYDDHVHRLSRRVIHLVMALAMLYMYLAAVPAEIGTGMAMGTATGTTSNFVLVPMVFILALLASAIWQLDSIGHFAAAPPAATSRRAHPGGCPVGGHRGTGGQRGVRQRGSDPRHQRSRPATRLAVAPARDRGAHRDERHHGLHAGPDVVTATRPDHPLSKPDHRTEDPDGYEHDL